MIQSSGISIHEFTNALSQSPLFSQLFSTDFVNLSESVQKEIFETFVEYNIVEKNHNSGKLRFGGFTDQGFVASIKDIIEHSGHTTPNTKDPHEVTIGNYVGCMEQAATICNDISEYIRMYFNRVYNQHPTEKTLENDKKLKKEITARLESLHQEYSQSKFGDIPLEEFINTGLGGHQRMHRRLRKLHLQLEGEKAIYVKNASNTIKHHAELYASTRCNILKLLGEHIAHPEKREKFLDNLIEQIITELQPDIDEIQKGLEQYFDFIKTIKNIIRSLEEKGSKRNLLHAVEKLIGSYPKVLHFAKKISQDLVKDKGYSGGEAKYIKNLSVLVYHTQESEIESQSAKVKHIGAMLHALQSKHINALLFTSLANSYESTYKTLGDHIVDILGGETNGYVGIKTVHLLHIVQDLFSETVYQNRKKSPVRSQPPYPKEYEIKPADILHVQQYSKQLFTQIYNLIDLCHNHLFIRGMMSSDKGIVSTLFSSGDFGDKLALGRGADKLIIKPFRYEIAEFIETIIDQISKNEVHANNKRSNFTSLYSGVDNKSIDILSGFLSTLNDLDPAKIKGILLQQILEMPNNELEELVLDNSIYGKSNLQLSQSYLEPMALYLLSYPSLGLSNTNDAVALNQFQNCKSTFVDFINDFSTYMFGTKKPLGFQMAATKVPKVTMGSSDGNMGFLLDTLFGTSSQTSSFLTTIPLGSISKAKSLGLLQDAAQIMQKICKEKNLPQLIPYTNKSGLQVTSKLLESLPGIDKDKESTIRSFNANGSFLEQGISCIKQNNSYYLTLSGSSINLRDYVTILLQVIGYLQTGQEVQSKPLHEHVLRFWAKIHTRANPHVDLKNLGVEKLNNLSRRLLYEKTNLFLVGGSGTGKTEYVNKLMENGGSIPFFRGGSIVYQDTNSIFLELDLLNTGIAPSSLVKSLSMRQEKTNKNIVIIVNEFMDQLTSDLDGFAQLLDNPNIRIIGTANLPFIENPEVVKHFLGYINKINRRLSFEFFYNTQDNQIIENILVTAIQNISHTCSKHFVENCLATQTKRGSAKQVHGLIEFFAKAIERKLHARSLYDTHGSVKDENVGLALFYGPLWYSERFFEGVKSMILDALQTKKFRHVRDIQKTPALYEEYQNMIQANIRTPNGQLPALVLELYQFLDRILAKQLEEFNRNKATYIHNDSILSNFETLVRSHQETNIGQI